MFRILFILVAVLMSGAAHATTCDATQYVSGDMCRTCPASATCDGVDFACNGGWYRDGDICTQCSVNNATCTGPDDYNCNAGFYDSGGACNACPENATCAGGHEYFYCADGYYKYTYGGATNCQSCAGHVCDGETLVSCGKGYYLSFTGMCVLCYDNAYCPAGSTSLRCQEGYYHVNSVCSPCPTGYYCTLGESTDNSVHNYCASGYYRTGGSCSPCPDDIVCPGGKIDEIVCPDGLFLHDNGQCLGYATGDCGDAPNCNPGCYDNGGACVACPVANSTCKNATEFSCGTGYYNNGAECVLCGVNSTCPAGSTQMTCFDGHYLSGDSCSICENTFYCIDNVRHKCPYAVVGETLDMPPDGYTFVGTQYYTTQGNTDITSCRLIRVIFDAPEGRFYFWTPGKYDGFKYQMNYSSTKYWRSANTGYYLDVPTNMNLDPGFYKYSLPCTNKPEHSYYTDAGTIGNNDCPWACESGYYRDGDVCLVCPDGMDCLGGTLKCPMGSEFNSAGVCAQLCLAGITTLNTSTGVVAPLFAVANTAPAIHIKNTNGACHADLIPGTGQNAIHIRYNGQVYHTMNVNK